MKKIALRKFYEMDTHPKARKSRKKKWWKKTKQQQQKKKNNNNTDRPDNWARWEEERIACLQATDGPGFALLVRPVSSTLAENRRDMSRNKAERSRRKKRKSPVWYLSRRSRRRRIRKKEEPNRTRERRKRSKYIHKKKEKRKKEDDTHSILSPEQNGHWRLD